MPLEEPVDWAEFERCVHRHAVGPLVHRSGWAHRHEAPQWMREALAARVRRHALWSLRNQATMHESVSALEREGISVVVLKGAAMAAYAYDDPAARSSGDLDLLVSADQVAASVRVLSQLGFEWRGWGASWSPPADEDGRETALTNVKRLPMLKHVDLTERGKTVEVHWQLAGNRHLLPLRAEWIEEPKRLVSTAGPIPALPLVPTWWHAAAHGATHLWAQLKWLADLLALAQRHPQLVSLEALEQARLIGIHRCVAGGLVVAERMFGRFLPEDARRWARAVPGTQPIEKGALLALERPTMDAGSVSPRALPRYVAERLALRADARYRVEEMRRILLEAAREWNAADPGLRVLARAPRRWIVRHRARQPPASAPRD